MIDSICHTSTKFAVSVDEGKRDFLNLDFCQSKMLQIHIKSHLPL